MMMREAGWHVIGNVGCCEPSDAIGLFLRVLEIAVEGYSGKSRTAFFLLFHMRWVSGVA